MRSLIVVVLLATAPGAAAAQEACPGLELVRASARQGIEAQLGVSSLAELPSYEIDQAIDDVSGTFAGEVRLRVTNPTGAPMRTVPILLHANATAELGGSGAGQVTITEARVAGGATLTFRAVRPTLVEVNLASPLAAGGRVTIALRYSGRVRDLGDQVNDPLQQAMSGMGSLSSGDVADYGLLARGDGILTAANAHPSLAPFREGRFDTGPPSRLGDIAYNGVACYRVRTVVPEGVELVTNLRDAAPAAASGGGRVFRSEGALVRDFVVIAGRDLQRQSRNVGDVRVTSIFRTRDARAGGVVLETAAAALRSYERRFGPYPWTELDAVEASLAGGAGGVEFSSLVLVAGMLYRSPADSTSPLSSLLGMLGSLGNLQGLDLDPGRPAPRGRGRGRGRGQGQQGPGPTPLPSVSGTGVTGQTGQQDPTADMLAMALEFTVAHEVAHQYFAGAVGNDSRRHPALDEPLAQFAAGLAYEDRHGRDAARRAMDVNVKMNYALYRALGGEDRPVLRDTASFGSPIEYAALVYGKAPYLYVALRRSLGDARLNRAIRAAVDAHRFRLATVASFIDTMEASAGGRRSGVRAAYRRWLEQTHGDEDLGVDDSGDLVFEVMFPPEIGRSLRETLPQLGMQPRDILRMLFGGGLGGGGQPPTGAGFDPEEALRRLLPRSP